jgi:hypothetical protein
MSYNQTQAIHEGLPTSESLPFRTPKLSADSASSPTDHLPVSTRVPTATIIDLSTLLPSFFLLFLFACWKERTLFGFARPKPPNPLDLYGGADWQQQQPVGDWKSLPRIEPIRVRMTVREDEVQRAGERKSRPPRYVDEA